MRPILAATLLLPLAALAGCGADGRPIAPSAAAEPAQPVPPDAPIFAPDGSQIVIQGDARAGVVAAF